MYNFLNRSFIAKIYVFPIYFLIKISHDTCQSNLRVLWRRAWTYIIWPGNEDMKCKGLVEVPHLYISSVPNSLINR